MSETKHTSGPWKVDHENRIMGPERPVAVISWGVDWRANARLIAAAPELLAACQAVCEEGLGCGSTWSDHEQAMAGAVGMVVAAIAKAEGQTAHKETL